MSLVYPIKSTPNEATIETLTNRSIINAMGALGGIHSAWIYKPTQQEERRLGFDGGLQGCAYAVAIQYKRIALNQDATCSVRIDTAQHNTLLQTFPKRPTPYVFYAFSICPDYESVDLCFHTNGLNGGRVIDMFLKTCVFVDVHDCSVSPKQDTSTLKFPIEPFSTPDELYMVNPKDPVAATDGQLSGTKGHSLVAAIIQKRAGIPLSDDAKGSVTSAGFESLNVLNYRIDTVS